MNKEYYNKLINEEIKYLIEKKEDLVLEISEIATTFEYHSIEDKVDLNKLEISTINEKRQTISAIYELINNLDNLRK